MVVVSGYNANTKRLHDVVYNFVSEYGISVKSEFDDGSSQLVKVIWGQDETARLYQNSERAKKSFPTSRHWSSMQFLWGGTCRIRCWSILRWVTIF